MQPTILFADNDPDFLATRAEFLEGEGYTLVRATNPTEARRALEQSQIDLAILDLRLRNDDDEKDHTGLTLAREAARCVPKIILTGYSFSWEIVRDALRPQGDGTPAAVDFVIKDEGREALFRAVRRALRGPLVAAESSKEYALRTIHTLLQEGFTATELKRFCTHRDIFRPVLSDLRQEPSVNELADALITYCQKRSYITELLSEIEIERPRRFNEYRTRLRQ